MLSIFSYLLHKKESLYQEYVQPKIYNNMLEVIGHTPLVKLNTIPKQEGLDCEFLVKCEFLNPFGSQKDRIANTMLREAEKKGKIKPGATLVEPTSGNTGISIAIVAKLKGYNAIITMPEKSSQEKQDVMRVCGAKVIRTPTSAQFDQPESHFSVAKALLKTIPNSFILDQYGNSDNPLAHYEGTGREVAVQCDGKLNYIFVPTGTGGTITGIGKIIKEMIPTCKVIGVDPYGSIIAQPDSLNERKEKYLVEGYGHGDFVPSVVRRQYVDEWIKSLDLDSLIMTRRLIKDEGMFCGGTSGAVVWAAITYAKEHKLGKNVRICCVLADTFRNYMTKVISDEWMIEKGFLEPTSIVEKENDLLKGSLDQLPMQKVDYFDQSLTVGQAIKNFEAGMTCLFIVKNNKVEGAITQQRLMSFILDRQLKQNDLASVSLTNDVTILDWQKVTIACLEKILERRNEVYLTQLNESNALAIFKVTQKDVLTLLSKRI